MPSFLLFMAASGCTVRALSRTRHRNDCFTCTPFFAQQDGSGVVGGTARISADHFVKHL